MLDRHVLIVEDNLTNLRLFALLLRDAGFAVQTATNAVDAMECIKSRRPDLILMDLRLPDIDGLTLTRSLRADCANNTVRIVAITAQAMVEDRERAFAAGCDGFIPKPIDTRGFSQAVASYLEDAR